MDCPICKAVNMYREDSYARSHNGKLKTPAAYYHCEECDSDFYWVKGRKGLTCISEGVSPVDLLLK